MAELTSGNGKNRPGGTANRPRVGTGGRSAVGTGKRPVAGTATYRPARGGGGRVAMLIMFMALAVAIGAGLAFKDEIFGSKPANGNGRKNGGAVVTAPPVPTPPTPHRPDTNPVPTPPDHTNPPDPTPPPPPPTTDNGAAEKAIASGKGLIARINYAGALKEFGSVETMKVSPDLAKEAAELARKAEAFDKLTRDIKPRADAGQAVSIVELANGAKIRGVATRKPDGGYSVLAGTAGGGQMTYTFASAEVRDVKTVDPAERRAELNKELNARMSRLGSSAAPTQLFDAAVYAIENGLREESLPVMEKAWSAASAAGKDLVMLVAEDQASRLFAQANWSDSIGQEIYARRYCEKIRDNTMYRKTSFFDAAENMLAMMDKRKGIRYVSTVQIVEEKTPDATPTHPPPTSSGPSSIPQAPRAAASVRVSNVTSKVDLSEANRCFEEGMNHYVKGMPGMPDCKSHQADARRLLRRAQEIYDAAIKADPKNDQLQSRATDCNMRLYGIMKMSTL